MDKKIKDIMSFYALCSKLKDTIRKGPLTWNANRERIESVAELPLRIDLIRIHEAGPFLRLCPLHKVQQGSDIQA